MHEIKKYSDLENAKRHPYRIGEYIVDSEGNIFPVPTGKKQYKALKKIAARPMYYRIHWQGEPIETEDGIKITPVYE